MSITFDKVVFVDDSDLVPIDAENLNNIENALKIVCDGGASSGVDADVVRGKNLIAPSDLTRGLEGHWSLADVPEYPDGTAIFFESDWLTVAGFSAFGSDCIVSFSNNHLVIANNGGNDRTIQKSLSISASKNLRLKVKDIGNLTGLAYYEGSSYVEMSYVEKGDYRIYTCPTVAITSILQIRFTTNTSADLQVKWIYVGDETYKSLALDTPALKKNGVVQGAVSSSYSPTVASLYFDRINDGLTLPIPDFTKKAAFSISLKVDNRLASNEAATIFSLGLGTNTNGVALKKTGVDSTAFLEWYSSGATEPSTGLGLTLNPVFSHIVLTYVTTSKLWALYLNGVEVTHSNLETAIVMPTTSLTIGNQANAGFFKGYIADISLYSRALTREEVWDLYQNSDRLDMNSQSGTFIRGTVPVTTTSPGTVGSIVFDAGALYVCVAPNSWKKATLATW